MKTDLQNIRDSGQFLEKYTKTIKSSNGDIRELNALYDPLVLLARNIINNMLELLSQEMDAAQRKNGMMMKE